MIDASVAVAALVERGVQRTVLPNGLTVLSEHLPGVRSVSLGAWVRAASDHRLVLLVSVQEYAAEKLDLLGGRAEAEARHGAVFAALGTDEALERLVSHGGGERWRALFAELDNLVAAAHRPICQRHL